MAEPRIPATTKGLRCVICSQILRNPVTIPCRHCFCMRCIQERWDHNERTKTPCRCPECGFTFSSRPRLTKNAALADRLRGSQRWKTGREKRKHSGGSIQSRKRTSSCTERGGHFCRRHGSSLDVYCGTDRQITYEVSSEHTGHKSVRRGRMRKQKEEVQTAQIKSNQILQKHEKKWKKLKKSLKQIEKEARNTEDYCESIYAGIIDSLQRHFLSVKELIRGQQEAAAAQLQISLQSMQVKVEELRHRTSQLERLAQRDDDVSFWQEWSSLRQLCEKDDLHGASEDPLLPFQFTKKAVDELGRQLKKICNNRFTMSENTEDGEQQESGGKTEEDDMQQCEASTSEPQGPPGVDNSVTVEPKTREDFLQYACSLSLDPATAHEDLVVSVGDKEVRLSPLKSVKSPAINYRRRFTHRRQVLCRERLAERCYYEVELEGDKAEIALTYEGIDRKSRTSLSAFGGNANSWSLDCSRTYSVSHKGDSIQLTTSPGHQRIGVYLEFRKGLLSFYEVSDRMKFLYKLEAEFKEPLYPGFWLGEKCCIRICDLKRDRM